MDYLNHLYEFVDGTIDSGAEQQLFYELANNEELRLELKQQIAVSNAVRTDFVAYNPSAESTIRIFSELGMGTAFTGALASSTSLSLKTKLLTMFGKYAQGVFTFLATSSLAVVAYFMLDLGNFNGSNNSNGNNSINVSNSNNNTPNSKNIPITSSSTNQQLQNDTTIKTEIVYKDRIIYKNDTEYLDKIKSNYNKKINELNKIIEVLKTENQNDIDLITQKIRTEVENDYFTAYHQFFIAKEVPIVTEKFIYQRESLPSEMNNLQPINLNETTSIITNGITDIIGENSGLSLETSWAQYFSEYNESVNPAAYQDFNNFRIGLLYDLDEEFSIGVDYRRENFYQIYNFIDANGDPYKYEQKPNFNSLSASLRYNPKYLEIDSFSPFAQLGFGGNEGGTVARLMLGTEYKITGNYKFIFAADYNSLNFRNNKIQYTSNKLGVHMGIGFDF